MTTRINQSLIILCSLLLLVSCSSKPKRHQTASVDSLPSQSSSPYRHYPLYRDDEPGTVRHKSSGEFPRPAEIEPQVAFWHKTYSKWGRSQIAMHDKVHMDIIYDVFDLPGEVSESLTPSQKDYIQERFHDWKIRLGAVEDKMDSGAALDADEKELVQYIAQKTGRRNAIQGASERLRYQRGMKERFMRGLEIGRRYDDQFRRIFRNAGLPEDLAYLPHVESSFQYNAHSSAGALGIWQFTAGAAKIFMNGDSSAAARLDPVNATHGAARYLSSAYDKLGSWPLAITSYNHGIGGMQRARNAYGHDFMRIVKHYNSPQFGFASRNYYAEFLAARDIASDPERYFSQGSDSENFAPAPDKTAHASPRNTDPIDESAESAKPTEVVYPETPLAAPLARVEAEPGIAQAVETELKPVAPTRSAESVPAESVQAEPTYPAEPARNDSLQAAPASKALPASGELVEAVEDEAAESAESEAAEFAETTSRLPRRIQPAVPSTQSLTKKTESAGRAASTTESQKSRKALTSLDAKKAPSGLMATDSKKTLKAATLATDAKKPTKTFAAIESKPAGKHSTVDNRKVKGSEANPKTFRPTLPEPKASNRQKTVPVRSAAKKSNEKIRVAKR